MTNEADGHYTSHPSGGHQPPKTDKPKAQNPPKSSGVPLTHDAQKYQRLTELIKIMNDDGFYTSVTTTETPMTLQPTDLELRIRKEVMDAVDTLVVEIFSEYSSERAQVLAEAIQDRLSLLWGEL